jgi:TfoX/Sxy family transcriptional regulator of competence genes
VNKGAGGAAWKKVPEALAQAFDAALPRSPLVERRRMFGCPCAFVNGNMFAGLHEERLIVRVPQEAAARPFVVMGRTMKEYAALDGALDLGEADMANWIERGFAYARALPPKARRPAKAQAAKTVKAAKAVRAAKAAKPRARSR